MVRCQKWIVVSVLWAVIGLAGCSDLGTDPKSIDEEVPGGPIDPPGPTVSFVDDIQPVFTQYCVGCHGRSGGLSLRATAAHTNLVNMETAIYQPRLRVVPGNPDASVLYLKMLGDASTGDSMPPSGPLDSATLELIRVWIAEGALNN